MATAYDTASIIIPKSAGYKSGSLYGWNPQTSGLVDFAVTRAGATATRVNEAGLIESVAANVPRIDWAEGGSCPSLLVEPSRKNLFLNSETGVSQSISVVSGRNYAVSFSGTGTITFSDGATGTLNGTGATPLDRVSTIITTSTTNVTCTISGTVEYVNFEINIDNSSVSYSTSWIVTAGTTETRNADVIQKTGIASLLGDSAGTIYLEVKYFGLNINSLFSISDNTQNNEIVIGYVSGNNYSRLRVGGSLLFASSGTTLNINNYNKIAVTYQPNLFNNHLNGALDFSETGYTTYDDAVLTSLKLSSGSDGSPFYGRIRTLVYYDYAFTNTEGNNLTT